MPTTIVDPLTRLSYLLARSDTWRTLVGATSGDEATRLAAALAKIAVRVEPGDTLDALPFALITGSARSTATRIAAGGGAMRKTYSLELTIYVAFDPDYTTITDERTQLQSLSDTAVAIMSELDVLSGTSSNLDYDQTAETTPPVHAQLHNNGGDFAYTSHSFTGQLKGSQTE